MDAWEVIKKEVTYICMDLNRYTFMTLRCDYSVDDDIGTYVIYIKDANTGYGKKYYVSKINADFLVDPKAYAEQLRRRIKEDFCIK